MVPATVTLRGLLIVGCVVVGRLGHRERRGDRDEAGCEKYEKALLEHGDLLFSKTRRLPI